MGSSAQNRVGRIVAALLWAFLFVLSIQAWLAFSRLPASSRPERLAWLGTLASAAHLAAIGGLLLVPFVVWLADRRAPTHAGLRLRERFAQAGVYPALLAALALGALYTGPFEWLAPLVRLGAGLALSLAVLWLGLQTPATRYRALAGALGWGAALLVVQQVLAAHSARGVFETAAYGTHPAERVTAGLLLALAAAPLPLAVRAARTRVGGAMQRIARLPGWAYAAWYGATILVLAAYPLLFDAASPPVAGAALAMTALSGLSLTPLALRYEAALLPALRALTHTPQSTLLTAAFLALSLVPFLAPNTRHTVLGGPATIGHMPSVWPDITWYLVDWALALALLLVAALALLYRGFRDAFARHSAAIVRRHGGLWWLLLAAWAFASAAWAISPAFAAYTALRLTVELLAALLVAYAVMRGWGAALLSAVIISAAVQGGLAVVQLLNGEYLGLDPLGEINYAPNLPDYRASGLTIHPNSLSVLLAIGLFAALALLWGGSKRGVRVRLAALSLVPIVLGLLAASSRNLIASTVIALAVLVASQVRSLPRVVPRLNLWAVLALLAVAVGAVVLVTAAGDTLNRLTDTLRSPEKYRYRLTFAFEDTEAVLMQEPLWGVGAGNLVLALDRLHNDPTALIGPAHNVLLIVWAELGLPGVFLFGAACAAVVLKSLLRPQPPALVLGIAFLAMCVSFGFDIGVMDARIRLLIAWVLGLWWGYRLRAEAVGEPSGAVVDYPAAW